MTDFLTSVNPATEEQLAKYPVLSRDEVNQKVALAHAAWLEWRKTDFAFRAKKIRKAARILQDKKEIFGRTMSLEMGKPLNQAVAEIEKCVWGCNYYADNAEFHLKDEHIPTETTQSYITYQPLGVILAVMPWNFPFWQVFRFAVPALMAGNVGLLKHASNVQGCAEQIASVFTEAGFPEGVFSNLTIPAKMVGDVIDNPQVKAITLTGSTPAGKSIAARAGSVLKKTVLELGGNDAYIILADANLDTAIEACTIGRILNTGQSCIAAKRFIVVDAIHDDFLKRLVERFKTITFGDPMENPDMGPLVNDMARNELHRQVEVSVANGAICEIGGIIPEGGGWFYPATVLSGVKPGMPAYNEELFGPVAAVIRAKDENDAIRIANDSVFGLGGAVFTSDIEKGTHIAKQVEAGSVFVNDFVKSDPRLPFGGIKESGYGRELSALGIREFVNIKTVVVK